MRTRSLLLAILSLVLLPMFASAQAEVNQGLGSPQINLNAEAPGSGLYFTTPSGDFGGPSLVAGPWDVWHFPGQLGNPDLFPSNGLIVDWTGPATGSGGLIWKPQGPMTFMIYFLRPTSQGWVLGRTRQQGFTNLTTFQGDSTVAVDAPVDPANIADIFFSYNLGVMRIGGSVGFSYAHSLTAPGTTSIDGVADSATTNKSDAWTATARAGVSFPVGGWGMDTGLVVAVGRLDETRKSGANAAIPNLSNAVSATNVAVSLDTRAATAIGEKLDFAGMADFSMIPQNYSASTAAGPIDTTTARIDPSGVYSAGLGTKLTWKATDALVIHGFLTAVFGYGSWVGVAGGVTPRPTDSLWWIAMTPTLAGEVKPFDWLTLRGGISYTGRYGSTTTDNNTNTVTTSTWTTGVGVSAGLSVRVTPKVVFDTVINLANFTGAAAIAGPFVSTSMKMDQ